MDISAIICGYTILYTFISLLIFLCAFNHKVIIIFFKNLPTDIGLLKVLFRLKRKVRLHQKKDLSTGKLFESLIAKVNPNKVALYFEEQKWTYREISKQSNQIANYFYNEGYRKGDVVALFMGNGPEYVFTILGLNKIGIVVALINPSLRLQQLKHCLEVAVCKGIIFKPEMYQALQDLKSIGGLNNFKLYSYDESISASNFPSFDNVTDLQRQFEQYSKDLPAALTSVGFADGMTYVYTSGTTGLPKAAKVLQSKFQLNSTFMNIGLQMGPEDITLVALPLCHFQGLVFGVGQLLCYGTPVVIIRKFSATNFWKQCIKYKATAVPYIGEFCKYLYAQPPSDSDSKHCVRIMLGPGLRMDLWEKFKKRFNINRILEYYGATEGNCTLLNLSGKPGSVGYLPLYSSLILPIYIVKVDKETNEPIRDPKTGFLTKCKPFESGEIIGGIQANPFRCFDGYTDKASTKSKIITDVFRKGDSYFRSGDILVRDEEGYFYFKDRSGDTFRWKGENVSTFEVEYVITMVCGMTDVTVYGVEVPGYGGKAGMAAIVDEDDSLNIKPLNEGIVASLAPYARPIFIRILKNIDITVTFKLKKGDLKKEGYDAQYTNKDTIYILINNKYEILTDKIRKQIDSGSLRL